MKCPYCNFFDSKVIESRETIEGNKIRRRRECISCLKRFTTYEIVEISQMIVIKKDGSRENFDSKKIFNGILKACFKRQVEINKIDEITRNIEAAFLNSLAVEIESSKIGEKVMVFLKDLDEVAYVRFASVYRQFKDLNAFIEDLKKLLSQK